MNAADDREAVDRVLRGDVAAFGELVQRWQRPLVNLAYRFCRDRGRAEDLAQEAFVRAFRGLARWRRDSAFSTWLFAVATNLYRSELRRIPARNVALDKLAEPIDPRDAAQELEDEDRRRVVRRVVRRALHSLPPKYRETLLLFYFHGLDVTEAARSLSLPEGTVKARLFRGREMLRRKLTNVLTRPVSGGGDGTR